MSNKSWLDRSLSLFTEVRAGEGASALILAANGFYLLLFYSVMKVVRDALILSESGAAAASYTSAGMALLLLFFVPAYSAFASRVNRVWLVCGVTLFFASHLFIFYLIGRSGIHIGIAFYLWIGVFNMVAVAQFWAFANDLYSTDRGKRLFPILGMGANLGAFFGAGFATITFRMFGAYSLLLIAAAGLLVPVGLTIWVNRREQAVSQDLSPAEVERPVGGPGGFQLVLNDRYLFLIALLVLVFSLVNTLGGFLLNTLIAREAAARIAAGTAGGFSEGALIGTILGGVQTWVNLLAFLLQAFGVSRIFKHIGVRGALFILPIISLGAYTAVAFLPIFGVIRWTKVFENGTDYSINNTTRHALFLPTSRGAKYKAKQVIDAFFVRTGDLLQALVVFIGVQLAFSVRSFALVNVVLVGIWLALAVAIAREHRKLVPTDAAEKAAA